MNLLCLQPFFCKLDSVVANRRFQQRQLRHGKFNEYSSSRWRVVIDFFPSLQHAPLGFLHFTQLLAFKKVRDNDKALFF